ncbi:hypothetical protein JCM8547_000356 [Rhodosporidiobolus lusitaniae]
MQTPELHDCAVCDAKTTQLWKVHKVLCPLALDKFSFPPLSADEQRDLPRARVWWRMAYGEDFVEQLSKLGSRSLSLSELCEYLYAEDSSSGASDSWSEFSRTWILAAARNALHKMYLSERNPAAASGPFSAWRFVASSSLVAVNAFYGRGLLLKNSFR